MGLLDIFSGDSGRNAAIWSAGNTQQGAQQQRDYINQGAGLSLSALGGGINNANYALTTGLQGAQGGLYDQFRNTADALSATTGDASRALTSGVTNAGAALQANIGNYTTQHDLGQGYLRNAGAQADAYYQPLAAGANAGYSAYGDAAGVNGAEGQARARGNFQAGPGYDWMLGQGIDASTRAASAAGMAASGNTMQAAQKYGSGLANQEWGNYVSRLNPYLNLAPQIAGSRAGIATNTATQQANLGQAYANQLGANQRDIASLHSGYGRDIAGMQLGYGDKLSGLYTGYGDKNAALNTGYGNTLASLYSGFGTNQAGIYGDQARNLANITGAETAAITGQGQAGLLAGQAANQNAWGAGMQLANLAANFAGSSGGQQAIKSAFA